MYVYLRSHRYLYKNLPQVAAKTARMSVCALTSRSPSPPKSPRPVFPDADPAADDAASTRVEEGRHSASSQGLREGIRRPARAPPKNRRLVPTGPRDMELPPEELYTAVVKRWLAYHRLDPNTLHLGRLDVDGVGILHLLAEDCKKWDMVQTLHELQARIPLSAFSQLSEGKFIDWQPLHVLANNKARTAALSHAEGQVMRMMIEAGADIDAPGAYRCCAMEACVIRWVRVRR